MPGTACLPVSLSTGSILRGEFADPEAPVQYIASNVLPAAVLTCAALEGDLTIARRHIVLLVELERLASASRGALEQSLLDNLARCPAPERDYDLAVAFERAVRAVVCPARARLDVAVDDVPDSARILAQSVINTAAPLQGAARTLDDLRVMRGYTEEVRATTRWGEQLYALAIAEQFERLHSDDGSMLQVIRCFSLFGALLSAQQACLAAAEQCERFALMSR